MKLTIQTNELKNALNTVRLAVESRSTLPVLSNVLIQVQDGRLMFAATNLEVTIQYYPPATTYKADQEGAVTVGAKLLTEIAGTLTETDTDMTHAGSTMAIVNGRNNTKLSIIDALDFPPMPTLPSNPTFSLGEGHLSAIVKRVAYAASVDEARPILNGVHLSKDNNGGLVVTATDGFRVAMLEVSNCTYDCRSIIVPVKSLQMAAKLPDAGGVSAYISEASISLKTSTWTLTSQLIDGNFPDVKSIIPGAYGFSIEVKRADLINAVKQAKIMRDMAKFSAVGDILTISASGEDGDTTASIDAVRYSGDDIEWGLNVRYLMDVLTAASKDVVLISLNGSDKPVKVFAEDDGWTNIIMPVHLQ